LGQDAPRTGRLEACPYPIERRLLAIAPSDGEDEHRLGDFFRQMRVTHVLYGGGIDHRQALLHQTLEGSLIALIIGG